MGKAFQVMRMIEEVYGSKNGVLEAKQVGILYHFTNIISLHGILKIE